MGLRDSPAGATAPQLRAACIHHPERLRSLRDAASPRARPAFGAPARQGPVRPGERGWGCATRPPGRPRPSAWSRTVPSPGAAPVAAGRGLPAGSPRLRRARSPGAGPLGRAWMGLRDSPAGATAPLRLEPQASITPSVSAKRRAERKRRVERRVERRGSAGSPPARPRVSQPLAARPSGISAGEKARRRRGERAGRRRPGANQARPRNEPGTNPAGGGQARPRSARTRRDAGTNPACGGRRFRLHGAAGELRPAEERA